MIIRTILCLLLILPSMSYAAHASKNPLLEKAEIYLKCSVAARWVVNLSTGDSVVRELFSNRILVERQRLPNGIDHYRHARTFFEKKALEAKTKFIFDNQNIDIVEITKDLDKRTADQKIVEIGAKVTNQSLEWGNSYIKQTDREFGALVDKVALRSPLIVLDEMNRHLNICLKQIRSEGLDEDVFPRYF